MAVTPTTWNPSDKGAGVTLSGANLTASCDTGSSVRSVFGATSGKYYWELTYPSGISAILVGVATSSATLASFPGSDAEAWAAESSSGNIYNGGAIVEYFSGSVPTTTLSVLLDATAKTLKFWADGVDFGVTVTLTGSQFYAVVGYAGTITANFGGSAFNHTPPAGYQAGFGEEDPNTYVQVTGAAVLSAGTPTVVEGPNVVVFPAGVSLISTGSPTVIAAEPSTLLPAGVKTFSAGAPAVIEGPNRVAQVEGAACFSAGEPNLQLGYPEVLEVSGSAVMSAGAPTALPYSNKLMRVTGAALLQSGYPSVLIDPILAGNYIVQPSGVKLTAAGTPALKASGAAQAVGATVFSAGVPSASVIVRPAGAGVVTAGTPSVGSRINPLGASVLRAGIPKLSVIVHPLGVSVIKVGTPAATGTAAIIAASGPALLSAGTPSIHTAVHPWGKTHCRSGTPTISRGAVC